MAAKVLKYRLINKIVHVFPKIFLNVLNKLGTKAPIHVKVYISLRNIWHYENCLPTKNIQFTAGHF